MLNTKMEPKKHRPNIKISYPECTTTAHIFSYFSFRLVLFQAQRKIPYQPKYYRHKYKQMHQPTPALCLLCIVNFILGPSDCADGISATIMSVASTLQQLKCYFSSSLERVRGLNAARAAMRCQEASGSKLKSTSFTFN